MKPVFWKIVFLEFGASLPRLLFFSLCLSMGVASVWAVSGFGNQVRSTLEANSRAMLGGDIQLQDVRIINEDVISLIKSDAKTLKMTQVTKMAAMAQSSKDLKNIRNVEVVAVSAGYPLVANAFVVSPEDSFNKVTESKGHAIVDEELSKGLFLQIEDEIKISGKTFTVKGFLKSELNANVGGLFFGPKIFVNREDAIARELLTDTNRLRDSLLVNVNGSVDDYSKKIKADLKKNSKIGTIAISAHSDSRNTNSRFLTNLNFFLSQISLATLALTILGVVTGLGELLRSRLSDVAIYRVLGADPKLPTQILSGLVILTCGTGAVFGMIFGEGLLYFILNPLFSGLLKIVPAVRYIDAIQVKIVVFGTLLPLLFLFPLLASLESVSPALVLNGTMENRLKKKSIHFVSWGLGLGCLLYLFVDESSKPWLGIVLFFTVALLFLLFFLLINLLIRLFETRESKLPTFLRIALGEISSRKTTSVLSTSLIGISIFFVSLVQFLKSDLQNSINSDVLIEKKPNMFFMDVQAEQESQLIDVLKPNSQGNIETAPITRARLISINGKQIDDKTNNADANIEVDSARQREQNLTWRSELVDEEQLVNKLYRSSENINSKKLWQDDLSPEISLESGFAKRLKVIPGDSLVFSIAGAPIEGKVTSLRSVNWQTFKPNFFVVLKPSMMIGAPHQMLMSVHAPSDIFKQNIRESVVPQFPNVSIIDVSKVLEQVSGLTKLLSSAASGLAAMLLVAGFFILVSGLVSAREAKIRNVALLRALGANKKTIQRSLLIEFILLGSFSSAIGVLCASVVVAIFTNEIFGRPSVIAWELGFVLWLGNVFVTCLAGYLSCRSVLYVKPSTLLRDAI